METYVDVEENFSRKEFKSYYVVWKQHIENKKKEADVTFKSYYVVWKLVYWFFPCRFFWCLNRTM